MPYANIGDVKLYYEIYGNELELAGDTVQQKPTLLVLHGGPGLDHVHLVPYLKTCSEFAQVIFLDHRGNGRSIDPNPAHWNLKQWGEDIYHFCGALGLIKPFIIGESFGGHAALQYAIVHPEHAGGIILTDSEGYFDKKELLDAYDEKGGKEIRDIAQAFFEDPSAENLAVYFSKCIPFITVTPMPEHVYTRCIARPEVTNYYYKHELFTFNFLPQLKNVKIPILQLVSTSGPVHRLNSAQRTADALTGTQVEFHAFPQCGIVAFDAKEQALAMIKKFIQKHYHEK